MMRKKREIDHSTICENVAVRQEAEEACAIINDQTGPFGVCYEMAERQQRYKSCLVDVCAHRQFFCEDLVAYADKCSEYGQPGDWRTLTGCRKS